MAKGFKHGAGGAVVAEEDTQSLNFTIVRGTTEPETPTDNMIWLNTEVEGDGWVFATTEPTEPVDGMAWFETALTSPVKFNAVSENELEVRPRTARIYTNGEWTVVTAKVWQTDAWVDLVDYNIIYDYGVNAVVTGEWVNLNADYCVLTILDTGVMDFDCNNGMSAGSCRTANKIDLTDKKTIWVDGHLPTHSGGAGVSTEENAAISKLVGIKETSDGIHSIDVTSLTGGYYFYVHAYNGSSIIRRIWME